MNSRRSCSPAPFQLAAAAQSGDAEAFAALYDENGAIIPPNEPAVIGRAAVGDWAGRFLERWQVDIDSLAIEDRRIGEDIGYARYRAIGRYIPKASGAAVPFDQKYVDTYVKDATGAWRMAAHILNSNWEAATIWD